MLSGVFKLTITMKRRDFFKVAAVAGVSYAASPVVRAADNSLIASANQETKTIFADASKPRAPRVPCPGSFRGKEPKESLAAFCVAKGCGGA